MSRAPSSRRSWAASGFCRYSAGARGVCAQRASQLTLDGLSALLPYGIVFNTLTAAIRRRPVRLAAALAVDRREIVDGYLYGFGTAAYGPLPPGVGTAPPPRPIPTAPDSARQLLGGQRIGFELLTVGSGEAALEQMLQAQLARAGFDVTIRQVELTAFLDRVYGRGRDFQAAVLGIQGDLGLGYLADTRPDLRGARADGPGRRGTDVSGFVACRLPLSCARRAGSEPAGSRSAHGPAGRAADADALVDGAVTRRDVASEFHATAPVRLDFAGGWTDVPPFSSREGGIVVNAAIGLMVHVDLKLGGPLTKLAALDLGEELECANALGLVMDGRLTLHKAALRMFPTQSTCTLTTRSDVPPGSGLGSSGALDVALVAALPGARGEHPSSQEIAEHGWYLETVEAQIAGGKQDQFAASLGGFHRLSFRDPDVGIEPITLAPDFSAALERQMLLCYTGQSRVSGATIARVMTGYERGDAGVTGALRAIKDTAAKMADALRAADIAAGGRAAHRELASSAGARPRNAHGSHASAGAGGGRDRIARG